MVEAANLLQVVFSWEQTHTGSNLHWSQSFKLRVYWDIHYRLSDLYPPITKIILFPLDKTIVFHFYDFVLVLSVVFSRCQLYSVSLSQRKLIPNSALFILPFREFYA